MAKSTRQQKIDWLLANQSIWEGYGHRDSMSIVPSDRYKRTVAGMQKAGLWSARNGGKMRDLGILISEARKQRREMQYA
jgi:hypothetical protein